MVLHVLDHLVDAYAQVLVGIIVRNFGVLMDQVDYRIGILKASFEQLPNGQYVCRSGSWDSGARARCHKVCKSAPYPERAQFRRALRRIDSQRLVLDSTFEDQGAENCRRIRAELGAARQINSARARRGRIMETFQSFQKGPDRRPAVVNVEIDAYLNRLAHSLVHLVRPHLDLLHRHHTSKPAPRGHCLDAHYCSVAIALG